MQEIIKELMPQTYKRNRQWTIINMGPKSGGEEGEEKGARWNGKHKRLWPCTKV